MTRYIALLTLFLAGTARAQDVPLEVKGDTIKVQVDKIVVVKEDRLLVKSLPFTVSAPPGAGLYFWQFPGGVQALDRGDRLEVIGAPKGPLAISVKLISADLDKDGRFKGFITKFGSVQFDVGEVVPPKPPTPPDPPKPPEPPPNPAPITEPGFRVMVIYETQQLTPGLNAIIKSKALWDYLDATCAKDGSTPARRFYDKDVPPGTDSFKWEQEAFARPRKSVPWLIVSNGVSGFEGPLPATVEATLELLKKFGG